LDGKVLSVNPAFAQMFGYESPDEVLTSVKNVSTDIFADPGRREEIIRLRAENPGLNTFENLYRRKDGSTFVGRMYLHTLKDLAGGNVSFEGFIEDISERKQAENALRDSEKRFSSTFEFAAIGVALVSPQGRFIKVNRALCNLLGYTSEELIALTFQDITHPDDLEKDLKYVHQMLNAEINTYQMEKRYFGKKGNLIWVVLSVSLVWDENGHPQYFISQIQDITERKRAEAALQARLDLSLFADSHSLDDLVQKALDKAEEMTGSRIGFTHFLESDQKTLVLQMWSTNTVKNMCTAEGKGSHYPIDKAGVWVDCVFSKAPVIHNDYPNLAHRKGLPEGHAPVMRELVVPVLRNGLVVMIMGVGNKPNNYDINDIEILTQLADFSWDIIQRKRAEEKLKENNSLLRIAEERAKLGGWSVDLIKKRVIWSDEVAAIHETAPGFSPSLEEGLNFYAPEWRERIAKVIDDCAREGIPFNEELEIITAKGRRVWVHSIGEAEKDEHGNIFKVHGAFQDISERKQAEESLRSSEALLKASQQLSKVGGWEWNIESQKVYWTEETYRIHDFPIDNSGKVPNDYNGRSAACYDPGDNQIVLAAFQRCCERGESYDLELPFTSGLGRRMWVRTTGQAVWKGERIEKVVGAIMDITERKKTEEMLRSNEIFIKGVLNSLTAHIAVLDEHGIIVVVNEAWKKFARENDSPDPDAYLGTNYLTACEAAIKMGDESANQIDLGIRAVMNGLRSKFNAEYSCDSPTQQRWFSITVVPEHQTNHGVIITHQDITESKQSQRSLEAAHLVLKNALDLEKQLARTDPLTSVNNRRYLYELAEHEFQISTRYQQPLSVMMIDIDHFKNFNDNYGHAVGDEILKRVTQTAAEELRTVDVIGRYGGEEFIVLLPMTNAEQAYTLAERIRRAAQAQTLSTDKGDTSITLSIGIIERKTITPAETVEEAFRRADDAMYAAKQAGRNRTVLRRNEQEVG
jgi:diguanylate cyclase (GGDEF)-like protein/PAS domain S-box-containing protein